MNDKKKISFTTKDEDGKELKLCIKHPSPDQLKRAQIVYNSAFARLIRGKEPLILRAALDDILRKQGLWDDDKQKKYEDLQRRFNELEMKLTKGGIKLLEARDMAIEMRKIRIQIANLRSTVTSYNNYTAEGQAQDQLFNFLVSECTLYEETGKRFFSSLEDYEKRATEESVSEAANKFAEMYYGFQPDTEKKLPENKFLIKYKFVDEDLRLVNSDGKLIDVNGRLINEDGNFIDERGHLIDDQGNKLTDEGEYEVESQPFLNEDGSEIVD